MVSRPLFVVDTNVLLDFHCGGALTRLFELPLTLVAPDVLVVVHGTLWLLDRLVEARWVGAIEARRTLAAMMNSGRRLPKNECSERLRGWK